MSIYKLFAAGTGGTENALAQLDIQFNGSIVGLAMSLVADLDTDLEKCKSEMSFISTNSLTSTDTRGSLLTVAAFASVSFGITQSNIALGALNIPVSAGERVWLHTEATAGVASDCTGYIYVDDGSAAVAQRRR